MEWGENLGSLGHTYLYLQEVEKINNTHDNTAPTANSSFSKTGTKSLTENRQMLSPWFVLGEREEVKTHMDSPATPEVISNI